MEENKTQTPEWVEAARKWQKENKEARSLLIIANAEDGITNVVDGFSLVLFKHLSDPQTKPEDSSVHQGRADHRKRRYSRAPFPREVQGVCPGAWHQGYGAQSARHETQRPPRLNPQQQRR